MVIGTILMKMAGTAYYSPTFGRGGLSATFVCETRQVAGTTPTLDIVVEHKNSGRDDIHDGRDIHADHRGGSGQTRRGRAQGADPVQVHHRRHRGMGLRQLQHAGPVVEAILGVGPSRTVAR